MLTKINSISAFVRNYLRYDIKREALGWSKIGRYYIPVLIPVAIVLAAALVLIRPFPNQETFLAIGQQGSLTDQLGKEFTHYFHKHGLDLKIENTTGLDAGLQKLDSETSSINASFVTSGTSTRQDHPELVSLGSVQLAPLWLFYRGDLINTDDPFEYYRDKRIGVGAEGTITNKLFLRLMELNNPGTGTRPNFLRLPHAEAAQQLQDGRIDAMFIVDGYNSDVIQQLLKNPNIRLMNFPLADAYTLKLPFLQKVIVPRASLDIDNIRPANDVALLASSVNLLIENNLHPAIQWAFLLAAQDANLKSENFFASNTSYPKYKDKTFPLSDVAERFYTSGTPALFNYLPMWLAALIENIWVELLALFLVVLPLLKKAIGFRSFASKKLLWIHFWELRFLEDEALHSKTPQELEVVIQRLRELEQRVASTWVEDQDMRHYYNLARCISSSVQTATKQRESLG